MRKQHWVWWLLLNLDIHHHKKKKKIGACVFWAPVFFLSFLAGKLNHLNRCYLQNLLENKQKTGTCVFLVAKKKASWKTTLSNQTNDTEIESLNGGRSFGKANETFCIFLLNLPKLSFGKIYFLPLLSTRLLAVRSSSPVVSAWFELQLSTIQLSAMVKETIKLTNTSTITSWKSNKII